MLTRWVDSLVILGLRGADPDPQPQGEPPAPPSASNTAPGDAGPDTATAVELARRLCVERAIETAKGDDGKRLEWRDPELIMRLIDPSKVQVNFATGEAEGIQAQLSELAKRGDGFLLKTAASQAPGGYGVPPGSGNSGHHEVRTTAAELARDHGNIYGEALRRHAGISD